MATSTILPRAATPMPQTTTPTPQPTIHSQLRAALRIDAGRIIAVMASGWDARKVSYRVSVVGADGSMTTVHRLFEERETLTINDLLWTLAHVRQWTCRPAPLGAAFLLSHRSYIDHLRQQSATEESAL